MPADLIGVLEAAYDLTEPDEQWLERVLVAAHPALNRGLGTAAFLYKIDREGLLQTSAPAMHGLTVPLDLIAKSNEMLDAKMVARFYVEPPPLSTMATMLGHSLRREHIANEVIRPHLDVADFMGVRADCAWGQGAFLAVPQLHVGPPPPREAMVISRLASHIGAGLRLRRRLASALATQQSLDAAEAILTPDGQIAHATRPAKSAEARQSLGEATRAQDRARGKLRKADPEEAVAQWRALVAGRWSLVDHFDHDGRRFIIAHQNQLLDAKMRLRGLSERERQVAELAALGHSNKLIAYELGVSLSTVSVYLGRAASKLGAASRLALVEVLRRVSLK